MLTHEEFAALMAILQRAPMTHGELLAVPALLAKIKPVEVKPVEAKQ